MTLALALMLGLGIGPVAAAGPDRGAAPAAAASKSFATEIKSANAALASAVANIKAKKYPTARKQLTGVRGHGTAAQVAATALIGRPPTDPESDDPPGPPAVTAVLGLERRIVQGLLPLFNKMKNTTVVGALSGTLLLTQVRRDVMLNKVIALPPEGAADDYADGMADSLGMFAQEVKAITAALATFTLTPNGKTNLTKALAQARATKARADREWGGGERWAAPTRQPR